MTTLPVWTIKPNWARSITELLEWQTDVLRGDNGAEQRRSVRISPRRSFEIDFNPIGNERTLLDLWMHSLSGQQCYLPLWHDIAALDAPANSTDTALSFDNQYREHRVGDKALLLKDAFTYEVVEISAVADDGVTLTAPLTSDWPTGSTLYPLRAAWLDYEATVGALTSSVGETSLQFTLAETADFPEFIDTGLTYLGSPVIQIEPNRGRKLSLRFDRYIDTLDNQTGKMHRVDSAGRAFSVQVHNWLAVGRAERYLTRQILYAMQGRRKPAWLPTFNRDIELVEPASIGATMLDVRKVGYEYVGGPSEGRQYVLLGGEVVEITGFAISPSPDTERVTLAAPLTTSHLAGSAGSFLDLARLDQDRIEITHHTDANGAMEVAGSFKTFSPVRDPSGPNVLPAPVAVKSIEPCGTPADGNPCANVFPGWFLKIVWTATPETHVTFDLGGWCYGPSTQPNAPNGKFVSGTRLGKDIYEKNNDSDPSLNGQLLLDVVNNISTKTWTFYYDQLPGDFRIRVQFPRGSWRGLGLSGGKADVGISYQWWNMSAPGIAYTGRVGGLWPYTYTFNVPARQD